MTIFIKTHTVNLNNTQVLSHYQILNRPNLKFYSMPSLLSYLKRNYSAGSTLVIDDTNFFKGVK